MLFSTVSTAGKARLTIAPDGPPGEGSGLQEHICGETGGRRGPAGKHRAASGGPRRGSGRGRRQGEPEWQAVSPTACRSGPPGPGLPIKKERLVLQQTSNYQLSQWDAEDRIQREDFNSDNAKVDAALAALSDTLEGHGTILATRGNCRIWTASYKGTASSGSDTSSKASCIFPEMPLLFLVFGSEEVGIFGGGKTSASYLSGTSSNRIYVTWSTSKATWYHSSSATVGLNLSTTTYQVIAFLPAKG